MWHFQRFSLGWTCPDWPESVPIPEPVFWQEMTSPEIAPVTLVLHFEHTVETFHLSCAKGKILSVSVLPFQFRTWVWLCFLSFYCVFGAHWLESFAVYFHLCIRTFLWKTFFLSCLVPWVVQRLGQHQMKSTIKNRWHPARTGVWWCLYLGMLGPRVGQWPVTGTKRYSRVCNKILPNKVLTILNSFIFDAHPHLGTSGEKRVGFFCHFCQIAATKIARMRVAIYAQARMPSV